MAFNVWGALGFKRMLQSQAKALGFDRLLETFAIQDENAIHTGAFKPAPSDNKKLKMAKKEQP